MKIKALILASLLFSTVSQAAFSDLAVLNAQAKLQQRIEYLFDIEGVKAIQAADKTARALDKVVKEGVRQNMTCLLIKNTFEKDQNAVSAEEVRAGKWTKTGTTVEELQGLNSLMADYIGARCMQVK